MLKLIIADDERIIQRNHIHHHQLEGIRHRGGRPVQNGMETYDMIMDETPDIVLTDIRISLVWTGWN